MLRDNLTAAATWLREKGASAAAEALVNFVAPYLIYTGARHSLGDVYALMSASAPPIAWSIIAFARKRRIDALSLLVLGGIALSLLAFFGGGGARFLQAREQLVAAAIGLVFLGSAAIGKPLIYRLARARIRRVSTSEADAFEGVQESPVVRRTMMLMTLAWGIGLVAESSLCCAMVFVLPIQQYLVVSPTIGGSMIGGLTVWSYWYARRRIGPVQQAAAGARGAEPASAP